MANIDDILTTQKNGVIAINNINQTISLIYNQLKYVYGTTTSESFSAGTLVVSGPGRLVSFSVSSAGTGVGGIYDASATGAISPSNNLAATPTTAGVYQVGMHFSNGLVIAPGTGQYVSVTYSLD